MCLKQPSESAFKMFNLINFYFRPFQESNDKIFTLLLGLEFFKYLEAATFLASIPEDERNDIANLLLNDLRQKYLKENRLRKYASKNLRKEYDKIF